jgi:hypothetical protein
MERINNKNLDINQFFFAIVPYDNHDIMDKVFFPQQIEY